MNLFELGVVAVRMGKRKVTLQTKILGLIIGLLLVVIALLTICFGFLQT